MGSWEARLIRRLSLTLAALLGLAHAADAGATIVPQKAMAGVRIGMTPARVNAAKGKPEYNTVRRVKGFGKLRTYVYGSVYVLFNGTSRHARVIKIETTGTAERTRNGIGVGSRRSSVARSVPRVHCARSATLDHCYVGRRVPNHIVTEFVIGADGRVASVAVARILAAPRQKP